MIRHAALLALTLAGCDCSPRPPRSASPPQPAPASGQGAAAPTAPNIDPETDSIPTVNALPIVGGVLSLRLPGATWTDPECASDVICGQVDETIEFGTAGPTASWTFVRSDDAKRWYRVAVRATGVLASGDLVADARAVLRDQHRETRERPIVHYNVDAVTGTTVPVVLAQPTRLFYDDYTETTVGILFVAVPGRSIVEIPVRVGDQEIQDAPSGGEFLEPAPAIQGHAAWADRADHMIRFARALHLEANSPAPQARTVIFDNCGQEVTLDLPAGWDIAVTNGYFHGTATTFLQRSSHARPLTLICACENGGHEYQADELEEIARAHVAARLHLQIGAEARPFSRGSQGDAAMWHYDSAYMNVTHDWIIVNTSTPERSDLIPILRSVRERPLPPDAPFVRIRTEPARAQGASS